MLEAIFAAIEVLAITFTVFWEHLKVFKDEQTAFQWFVIAQFTLLFAYLLIRSRSDKSRQETNTKRVIDQVNGLSRRRTGHVIIEKIISAEPQALWRATGPKGASKKRFFRYFSDKTIGHAFKIATAVKYTSPIRLRAPRKMATPTELCESHWRRPDSGGADGSAWVFRCGQEVGGAVCEG